ncbi:MAG: ComF family protein [Actinomycetales bacterium]
MIRSPFATARADVADLVLGRRCAVCDQGSGILCSSCWVALLAHRPYTPRLPGLQVVSAWPYQGAGGKVLLAYKERGSRDLVHPLAIALARCLTVISDQPLAVIPMPAHQHSITERGFDVVAAIAQQACHMLVRAGHPAWLLPVLAWVGQSPRQVGRGRRERLNLASTQFRVCPGVEVSQSPTPTRVVLVDDVVTTGATLRAARASLSAHGLLASVQATIAATEAGGYPRSSNQPG